MMVFTVKLLKFSSNWPCLFDSVGPESSKFDTEIRFTVLNRLIKIYAVIRGTRHMSIKSMPHGMAFFYLLTKQRRLLCCKNHDLVIHVVGGGEHPLLFPLYPDPGVCGLWGVRHDPRLLHARRSTGWGEPSGQHIIFSNLPFGLGSQSYFRF